jgi:hypothetical protein
MFDAKKGNNEKIADQRLLITLLPLITWLLINYLSLQSWSYFTVDHKFSFGAWDDGMKWQYDNSSVIILLWKGTEAVDLDR